MREDEKFLVLLSQFEITNKKIENILAALGDDISIKNFFALESAKKLVGEELYANMQTCASATRLEMYLTNLKNAGITLLTRFSDGYPYKLEVLPDAPYFLFCKGNIDLLKETAISIVGSRTPSNYGRIMTDRFSEGLAKAGVVVVSGLAYGVDSIAHRKALEVGGKTIAVLGSGMNNIYPAEHTSLAKEIAEKGLLISEYCPSMKATRYTFPQRNRIIAGLSDGVLITEAGLKSGTVHTKDFALDYGKDVFALPGNVTSEKSELPNGLIKSGQGQAVTEADDILKFIGFERKEEKKTEKAVKLSFEEQEIVNLLSKGDKDMEFLSKNSTLNINILNSYLTTLEIRGIIRRLPGGVYVLV